MSNPLYKKRILIGLTAGIACYKIPCLIRLLRKEGAAVQVVMTQASSQFITPVTLQAISGNRVITSQWDSGFDNNMAHIDLSRDCDLMLIAPTSADFMAQLASGQGRDLLSLLCLARVIDTTPLLVAPAMNREMWQHPAVQRNGQQLSRDGAHVLGVGVGSQACGEEGDGRMLEPQELLQEIVAALTPKLLAGKRVLVNAGPTYEAIDPVRGVTNLSSGKTGFSIAQAAWEAGAEVTLVSGPVGLETPYNVKRINVLSAKEMQAACQAEAERADIFFATAAVADWRVETPLDKKIKKGVGRSDLSAISFIENPDVLASIAKTHRAKRGELFCVGFAAESHDIEQNAIEKRLKKGVPVLVANDGPATFGRDENAFSVISGNGIIRLPKADKLTLARELLRMVAAEIATVGIRSDLII